MQLSSGDRLGPYEILSPLGAGGMGEVYKARDTRLGREVAIKVLPANRVSDPRRKARFAQEARAASALNHPNIVTIHDIAEADGVDFLVMELVQGRTLDQLIGRNGLANAEAIRYALALAEALTKAHAAGIVHRDLKPGNIIVNNEGVLKVLDFGLAKLAEREDGVEPGDPTQTIEGTIVGTAAYMSPEQAEGKPVDARSDIFSFGCVLYEMVTGRRAFSGETQASTLASVLREEPKPLSELTAGAPRDLERITQRCLRKDPARRFQHIADVKVELEDIKDASDSAATRPAVPMAAAPTVASTSAAGRRRWAVWGAVALLLIAAAVAAAWLRLGSEAPAVALAPVPLVTDPGDVSSPTFSPDGNQVAYAWNGEHQDNNDIYVKLVGSGKPLRLTSDPAYDSSPAWSPDGRAIAFIRGRRSIYLVSPLGGGERKVAEGIYPTSPDVRPTLSWSPDSRVLALSAVNSPDQAASIRSIRIEDGEKQELTTPPATLGDYSPAISPDGRRLVFVRCARTSYICGLYLLDLTADYHAAGQPRLLGPEGGSISNPIWTADGRDIVYMFGPAGQTYHLERIRAEAGARSQRLTFAGEGVTGPAISAHGNRLAYAVNLSDSDLRAITPGGSAHSIASSTRVEHSAQFSPDGQRIAFASDRTGVMEVWVCERDGANPVQLTRFGDRHSGTPRWSPDGRFIAFDSQTKEGWRIFVMPSDSGQSRRLTSDTASEIIPSWSADGKTIYFSSDRSGRFEIWKAPVAGGKATQVTQNGGYVAFESRDGRSLYYVKSMSGPLWGRPVEGGEEKQLIDRVLVRGFVVEDDGIYYVSNSRDFGEASVQFYHFATGKSEPIVNIEERRANLGLSVSPDRKTFLYSAYTRLGENLMLVEGFK